MKKIFKYITHPSLIKNRIEYSKLHSKRSDKMPDEVFLQTQFKLNLGYNLNIDNPVSFNEKLQWLKINDRKPIYTDLCDKIKVKKIVAELLGEDYILPTLAVYNNTDEINYEKLPDRFALKCNHDSGSVVVCKNKDLFDIKKANKKLRCALYKNFYGESREWPYKNIERRIFAEQYIESEDGTGIVDYKFFCFNGHPKFIYVSKGLDYHPTASISFFDLEGNRLPFKRNDFKEIEVFEKPNNLKQMCEIAEKLAQFSNSKFVRVDLYTVNNRIYFSEFTFFPCGGYIPFEPKNADFEIGKMLNLGK